MLGLSLKDFHSLTPEEFRECCKSRNEFEESKSREEWERMRILATIVIQPHCKKRINMKKILPMPWDKYKEPEEKKLTREERKARFEKLMAAMPK